MLENALPRILLPTAISEPQACQINRHTCTGVLCLFKIRTKTSSCWARILCLFIVQYRTKLSVPLSRPPGPPPRYRTWNLPRNGGGNRKMSPQGRRRIPHMYRTVRAVLFSILTLRLSRGRGTLAEFCSFYFLLPFSFYAYCTVHMLDLPPLVTELLALQERQFRHALSISLFPWDSMYRGYTCMYFAGTPLPISIYLCILSSSRRRPKGPGIPQGDQARSIF